MLINKCDSYLDSLGKNTVVFFKMSRSIFSLAFSSRSCRTSSSMAVGRADPGKAWPPSAWIFSFHDLNNVWFTPNLRAATATDTDNPSRAISSTASHLNCDVCVRRPVDAFAGDTDCDADTDFFDFSDMLRSPHGTGYSPFPAPTNRGEVQILHSPFAQLSVPIQERHQRKFRCVFRQAVNVYLHDFSLRKALNSNGSDVFLQSSHNDFVSMSWFDSNTTAEPLRVQKFKQT